jgi:hypothetical protein
MIAQTAMKNVLKQKVVIKCKACGGTGVVQTGKRGKQPFCRVCGRTGTHEFDLEEWEMSIVYEPIPVSVDMKKVCESAIEEVKDLFKEDIETSPEKESILKQEIPDADVEQVQTEEENDEDAVENHDVLVNLGLIAYCA